MWPNKIISIIISNRGSLPISSTCREKGRREEGEREREEEEEEGERERRGRGGERRGRQTDRVRDRQTEGMKDER